MGFESERGFDDPTSKVLGEVARHASQQTGRSMLRDMRVYILLNVNNEAGLMTMRAAWGQFGRFGHKNCPHSAASSGQRTLQAVNRVHTSTMHACPRPTCLVKCHPALPTYATTARTSLCPPSAQPGDASGPKGRAEVTQKCCPHSYTHVLTRVCMPRSKCAHQVMHLRCTLWSKSSSGYLNKMPLQFTLFLTGCFIHGIKVPNHHSTQTPISGLPAKSPWPPHPTPPRSV